MPLKKDQPLCRENVWVEFAISIVPCVDVKAEYWHHLMRGRPHNLLIIVIKKFVSQTKRVSPFGESAGDQKKTCDLCLHPSDHHHHHRCHHHRHVVTSVSVEDTILLMLITPQSQALLAWAVAIS